MTGLHIQPRAPAREAAPRRARGWREHAASTRVFEGYTYAYPHKTAYRAFDPPRPLADLWRDEDRRALFLYLHVPFCEMRCGFCNLFTRVERDGAAFEAYLAALSRQARRVRSALGEASFARVAIGGGTPTQLSAPQLERLLDVADELSGGALGRVPFAVETSPDTATLERLALLRARGVDRVSMGVQSFLDEELRALGRPTTPDAARAALDRIRAEAPAVLNVDLIYGADGQTPASFARSVDELLGWRPEEVFLYPLYVRPLTGLGRRGPMSDAAWDEQRVACYREGRARLLDAGYEQISLRLFRRADAPVLCDPPYACQADGMVGLGCGARSYTRSVHYADEWAVGKATVREILDDWCTRDDAAFDVARHGYTLDAHEQRTRWLLQSLLQAPGVARAAFVERFGVDVLEARPELAQLADEGLLVSDDQRVALTAAGLEQSDRIGPWLWSGAVHDAMREYELR
jgi:oxygen-independent coproporphyrinogen-3 oxidase